MNAAITGAALSELAWEDALGGFVNLLIVFAALWIIAYLLYWLATVASGVWAWATKQRLERNTLVQQVPVHGFPVVAEAGIPDAARGVKHQPPRPVQAIGQGPGRYRIVGVVAATGTDIQMYVDAATPANAKVKAELKGVVVTEVEKQ